MNKKNKTSQAVEIKVFRWAGKWGPFKIKISCGECTLTTDIVNDVLQKEAVGIPVNLQIYDWLSCWWKTVLKGSWHAPIVMVNNIILSEGKAINRGLLAEAISDAYTKTHEIRGNHIFGKKNCSYCVKAKNLLDEKKIKYEYHDVIENSPRLYEMIYRAKKEIGYKTPVTTPQIWLEGEYIGGADNLQNSLDN